MAVSEKDGSLSIKLSGDIHFSGALKLRKIRGYIEKRLWFLLILIVLNVISPFIGFLFQLGMRSTIVIGWMINAISFYLGYMALRKVREITILEGK
jgi:hypothetical protein